LTTDQRLLPFSIFNFSELGIW